MSPKITALPPVASQDEWLAARRRPLASEKEATRIRDAVNAERRRLPMVKIEKDYTFEGPAGKLRLSDLFEGRRQLYIHHFMWVDARDTGCPSCTVAADMTLRLRSSHSSTSATSPLPASPASLTKRSLTAELCRAARERSCFSKTARREPAVLALTYSVQRAQLRKRPT